MNLFIIAAGNGSRLGAMGTPKALFPIGGVPNLVNTIEKAQATKAFTKICVIISEKHTDHFEKAIRDYQDQVCMDNVMLIPIESGKGSGHAVLETISMSVGLGLCGTKTTTQMFNAKNFDVFCWGDTYFFSPDILLEIAMLTSIDCPLVIPVIMEDNPYLSLEFEDGTNQLKKADFSKPQKGYHDQSVFVMNSIQLFSALKDIHDVIWDQNRYTTDVGEFSFMMVIQYLWNIRKKNSLLHPAKAYITQHFTKGYNTLDEVRKIEEML